MLQRNAMENAKKVFVRTGDIKCEVESISVSEIRCLTGPLEIRKRLVLTGTALKHIKMIWDAKNYNHKYRPLYCN